MPVFGYVNIEQINNSDQETHPSEINVRWVSSIDGVLYEGDLTDNFESTFSKKVSKGFHEISFQAFLKAKNELLDSDSIAISNIVSFCVSPTDKSIMLNWSKYSGANFESYRIYRNKFVPIAEIAIR